MPGGGGAISAAVLTAASGASAGAAAAGEGPHDPARLVVKATAVAHQRSPGRAGDDVASGGHTVLERHWLGFYSQEAQEDVNGQEGGPRTGTPLGAAIGLQCAL